MLTQLRLAASKRRVEYVRMKAMPAHKSAYNQIIDERKHLRYTNKMPFDLLSHFVHA